MLKIKWRIWLLRPLVPFSACHSLSSEGKAAVPASHKYHVSDSAWPSKMCEMHACLGVQMQPDCSYCLQAGQPVQWSQTHRKLGAEKAMHTSVTLELLHAAWHVCSRGSLALVQCRATLHVQKA